MDEAFHYTDPRGRRSGPFSQAELRSLAERGLLEPDGVVEDGSGLASWRVGDLGWPMGTRAGPVGPAAGASASAPDTRSGVQQPPAAAPPPPPPDAAGDPRAALDASEPIPDARRIAPPRSPDDPAVRRIEAPAVSTLSRTAYVLLAVLLIPFFAFGVHNLAAGYMGRGVVQLLLGLMSLATVAAGGWFAPLCCCFGGPLYAALALWSLFDAIMVTRDAHGLRLA